MLLHLLIVGVLVTAPVATSWERADAHAAAGRHDDAALDYSSAWDEYGATPILYSWAQSERLAGRCPAAIDLYERFLANEVPPADYDTEALRAQWESMRKNARAQASACREQSPPVDDEPASPSDDAKEAEPAVPPPAAAPPTDRVVAPPRTRPRPWWRDATGWGLSASGVAVLATGATLVGVAARTSADADDRGTHQSFRDDIARAQLEQRIGIAALAVGGALVLAGAIRWSVVARRDRKAQRSVAWIVRF
jgi:hypothetical protein